MCIFRNIFRITSCALSWPVRTDKTCPNSFFFSVEQKKTTVLTARTHQEIWRLQRAVTRRSFCAISSDQKCPHAEYRLTCHKFLWFLCCGWWFCTHWRLSQPRDFQLNYVIVIARVQFDTTREPAGLEFGITLLEFGITLLSAITGIFNKTLVSHFYWLTIISSPGQ